jgi:hypothetical protein
VKLWRKLKSKFEVRISVSEMRIDGWTVSADAYILIRIGKRKWFPRFYRAVGQVKNASRRDIVEWMDKGSILDPNSRIAKHLTSTYNDFRMSKYDDFKMFKSVQIANDAIRKVRELT